MHEARVEGTTDVWLTPRSILNVLGKFDLDPCAAPTPRPWSTAKRNYDITCGQDGLKLPWRGRVWCNPPFTLGDEFMQRMAAHNNGIALLLVRSETKRWQNYVWAVADSVLLCSPRVKFYTADGTLLRTSPVAPTALIAYGRENTKILHGCGLHGTLLTEWSSK